MDKLQTDGFQTILLSLATALTISAVGTLVSKSQVRAMRFADRMATQIEIEEAQVDAINHLYQIFAADLIAIDDQGQFRAASLPEGYVLSDENILTYTASPCHNCSAIVSAFKGSSVATDGENRLLNLNVFSFADNNGQRVTTSASIRLTTTEVTTEALAACPFDPIEGQPPYVASVYYRSGGDSPKRGWVKLAVGSNVAGDSIYLGSQYKGKYINYGNVCTGQMSHTCRFTPPTDEYEAENHNWTIDGFAHAGAVLRFKDANAPCQFRLYSYRQSFFGSGCFRKGTAIRMANGSDKLIEDIRPGELAYNPRTGKSVQITELTKGPENTLLHLTVGGKSLFITKDHPFATVSGLKQARQLMVGDRLSDGKLVEGVETIAVDEDVLNFSLDTESLEADDHMLLANGIETGDLWLQKDLAIKSNFSPPKPFMLWFAWRRN
jgi:hypothetical protein